jgi:hypothetical protein
MIVLALIIAAVVVAIVAEVIDRGTNILGWAVILLCAALLVGRLA